MKNCFKKLWKEWRGTLLFIGLVVTPVKSVIADMNWVPTGSMNPTILEGDLVFINKAAYDIRVPLTSMRFTELREPQRGDIVVFFSPEDGTRMVKRVVARPGETIELKNNIVLINGQALDYRRLSLSEINGLSESLRRHAVFAEEDLTGRRHAVMSIPSMQTPKRNLGPVTVPSDHYFVMGDNRDNSMDSRFYGFVKKDRIVGEAKRVIASFDINQWLKPRIERFGKSLR